MKPRVTPTVVFLLIGLAGPSACQVSDVGAPCNHGPAEPQENLTVTFPALACRDLVCVYSDRQEAPDGTCETHADCNVPGESETAFRCEDGTCQLSTEHVLERSMCSQFCSEDQDCAGGDPGTNCETGFACVPPQDLGPFCCQKMCLCRDSLDLTAARRRAEQCADGSHEGCCQGADKPETCGP